MPEFPEASVENDLFKQAGHEVDLFLELMTFRSQEVRKYM